MGSLEAQFLDLLLGFGLSGQSGDVLDLKLLVLEGWDASLRSCPGCFPSAGWVSLAVRVLPCLELSLTQGGGVSLCSTYRRFGQQVVWSP